MDERKSTPVIDQPAERLTTADVAAAATPPPQDERERLQNGEPNTPLFAREDAERLREEWTAVQAGFVDSPRDAVEHADGLVADVMKRLAEVFASERSRLESQWDKDGDVSTEDLRVALQRYRSFFNRLLSV